MDIDFNDENIKPVTDRLYIENTITEVQFGVV